MELYEDCYTDDYLAGYEKYGIREYISSLGDRLYERRDYKTERRKNTDKKYYQRVDNKKHIPVLDGEEWLPYEKLPDYEVSSCGRVRNRSNQRILQTSLNHRGYERISITNNKNSYNMRIHRMVAETFHKNEYEDNLDVNHIDGDKTNNRADNLEWCTRQENVQHAFKSGLKNSDHRKRKVRIIETGEEFDSVIDCSNYLRCDKSSVGGCLNKRWNTCKGYHIEYVD